ncbi:MAG: acyl-CoA dehydrogenase [Rhizobiaceae bacterium]|nr:acyl-CoA dehydrogenase [Rhizobiaceae bacterium]
MYRAPVEDITHTLNAVAGLSNSIKDGKLGELSDDLVTAILEEAAKFASEEIAPLNRVGDENGAKLIDGEVITAPGWKKTYQAWTQGGWNSLTGPEAYGGQGLPTMLSVAVSEMWNSAAMAFGLAPLLTAGAVDAIETHGSQELKDIYLEKMVSGQWMGTMNLTEPQAGSYLAALTSRAEPAGDGSYRVFGQKIFITYGEHDLTENICHLVLARLPGAPEGTRGISLFLVPKVLVNSDGTPGKRNDVLCQSLEHKLGIHASPTCVMIFGDNCPASELQQPGAIGYLVGEENRGLNCMFTMMNNARLHVGVQGVAIGEAAYQHALAYANERTQGFAQGYDGKGMAPIVMHPDVARNLLTMKSLVQASRGICYTCAHAADMSKAAANVGDQEAAKMWSERVNLLTPVAKSFSTDAGVEVASIGVQVHGGMGFIEETGAAQFLRDARINPIYEGTNGIQAIDLVTRKLPMRGGEAVSEYFDELSETIEAVRATNEPGFGSTADLLANSLEDLREATKWLQQQQAAANTQGVLAGATPYQSMFGLTSGGIGLAKAGLAQGSKKSRDLARFYAQNLLGQTSALKDTVIKGADSLAIASDQLYSQ